MHLLNVLENITDDTGGHDIKTPQKEDANYKCIYQTLHMSLVHSKFTIRDNILFKILKECNKSFEAL